MKQIQGNKSEKKNVCQKERKINTYKNKTNKNKFKLKVRIRKKYEKDYKKQRQCVLNGTYKKKHVKIV